MSWYYNYYLGYKKDGKIYPLGLFDGDGKIHNVFSRSRSFASHLWEKFRPIKDDEITDELKKAFPYEFEADDDNSCFRAPRMEVLPESELPNSDFVKSGYFLIDDVVQYRESGNDSEGLFYDRLSPEVYAARLPIDMKKSTKPKRRAVSYEEDEGEEHLATDYMYFCYPDYDCVEYESHMIKLAANSYEYAEVLKDAEIVILLTQG